MQKFKIIGWATASLMCILCSGLNLGWRFRLSYIVHISKVSSVPAASTNYLPWFLCPLNSWNKDIYADLCASASSSVVAGALGTQRGIFSLDILNNGLWAGISGAEASQWIALCSHNGSNKGIIWVSFLPLKQLFDTPSNFLIINFRLLESFY